MAVLLVGLLEDLIVLLLLDAHRNGPAIVLLVESAHVAARLALPHLVREEHDIAILRNLGEISHVGR